jgi:hypothetical protein
MGEWEHYCQSCKKGHLAGFWYYRTAGTAMTRIREWMCGSKYNDLSLEEKEQWRPFQE